MDYTQSIFGDDPPPEWAAEASKIKPTWPKTFCKQIDYPLQTYFPMTRSEVYVPSDYPFKFVRRMDWGAKQPKFFAPMEQPVSYLVIQVTGTHECRFHEDCVRVCRKLQEEHMTEENVPDIKYSFLVGGDGVVYEGRGWNNHIVHTNPERAGESWQKLDWNGKSYIFAYIGPYDSLPSSKALETMRDLMGMGIKKKHMTIDFLRIPGFFTKPDT